MFVLTQVPLLSLTGACLDQKRIILIYEINWRQHLPFFITYQFLSFDFGQTLTFDPWTSAHVSCTYWRLDRGLSPL